MDVLIKKLETEVDPDRRRALAIRILNKVGEDIPKMYVGFVSRFWGLRDYVKGFGSGSTYMMWYGGGLNYVWLDK